MLIQVKLRAYKTGKFQIHQNFPILLLSSSIQAQETIGICGGPYLVFDGNSLQDGVGIWTLLIPYMYIIALLTIADVEK